MGGMPTSGIGEPYFNGHALEYTCDTGFESTENPIMCTCDTIILPPQWDCSTTLTMTCRRSEYRSINVKFRSDCVKIN